MWVPFTTPLRTNACALFAKQERRMKPRARPDCPPPLHHNSLQAGLLPCGIEPHYTTTTVSPGMLFFGQCCHGHMWTALPARMDFVRTLSLSCSLHQLKPTCIARMIGRPLQLSSRMHKVSPDERFTVCMPHLGSTCRHAPRHGNNQRPLREGAVMPRARGMHPLVNPAACTHVRVAAATSTCLARVFP